MFFWQDYPKTYPLIILIIGLYALKIFTLWAYRRKNNIKGNDNFIIGINAIYYLFFSILLIILIMVLLKVSIREFFTSISIIAAAIAIVSKDYISNAINGMILMFNNQISIGDYIQIGEHKGKIMHISLLNIQIVNEEDDLVYIPNTTVLSHEIINFTKGESHKTSMEFMGMAGVMPSIEELEEHFTKDLSQNTNIQAGSFRLKIIKLKYDTIQLRAEAILVVKDSKSERLFKRQLVNTWFQYLQKSEKYKPSDEV